jgi:hypothetical protein
LEFLKKFAALPRKNPSGFRLQKAKFSLSRDAARFSVHRCGRRFEQWQSPPPRAYRQPYSMLKPGDAIQQLLLLAGDAGSGVRITRMTAKAGYFRQGQARELHGAGEILHPALVVEG